MPNEVIAHARRVGARRRHDVQTRNGEIVIERVRVALINNRGLLAAIEFCLSLISVSAHQLGLLSLCYFRS